MASIALNDPLSCIPGTSLYPSTTYAYPWPNIYPRDVWVAYHEDDVYWIEGIFTEELEALRYAVNEGLKVKKLRSGGIDQWDDA